MGACISKRQPANDTVYEKEEFDNIVKRHITPQTADVLKAKMDEIEQEVQKLDDDEMYDVPLSEPQITLKRHCSDEEKWHAAVKVVFSKTKRQEIKDEVWEELKPVAQSQWTLFVDQCLERELEKIKKQILPSNKQAAVDNDNESESESKTKPSKQEQQAMEAKLVDVDDDELPVYKEEVFANIVKRHITAETADVLKAKMEEISEEVAKLEEDEIYEVPQSDPEIILKKHSSVEEKWHAAEKVVFCRKKLNAIKNEVWKELRPIAQPQWAMYVEEIMEDELHKIKRQFLQTIQSTKPKPKPNQVNRDAVEVNLDNVNVSIDPVSSN